jgi:hypothetical protein
MVVENVGMGGCEGWEGVKDVKDGRYMYGSAG